MRSVPVSQAFRVPSRTITGDVARSGTPVELHGSTGFTAVYALACLLCVAATFGPMVLAVLVCVLLPVVWGVAWRRA